MKLTSAQKMIAALVGIALLAILVIVLLVMPQFAVMASLDSEAEAARQQQQQARATLAQLEAAKQNAAATQAELLQIGTMMPEAPQQASLIIELGDIANLSGVTLTRIVPAQPAAIGGAGYSELSIETATDSSWADLLDYMRRVNSTTRLLRVTDVSVAPMSTESTAVVETRLNTVLKMKAFVYSGGASGGTPPAPTQ